MKKICVVTGTRAEYGLFYPLLQEIRKRSGFQLQILVTGMHLAPEFGMTYTEIEKDGFTIDEKVEMSISSDTAVGVTSSMGVGMIGFGSAFARLRPDLVLLIGDRYETIGAALAATVANIPIAHLHGGERSEGTMDDVFRHAITKLSHLHFTATEEYRNRVIQLGESPDRVFAYGALAADQVKATRLMSKEELEASIGFPLDSPVFLVTFHPVTWTNLSPDRQVQSLLDALEAFPEARVLFTKPNSDPGGRQIGQMIDEFALKHGKRIKAVTSLGRQRYLSALQYADAVIGNSSSGIIEAPLFRKATVNIGDRQNGRIRARSVIDCANGRDEIVQAVRKAMSESFRRDLDTVKSLYGEGDAARKIVLKLSEADFSSLIPKTFYDLDKG